MQSPALPFAIHTVGVVQGTPPPFSSAVGCLFVSGETEEVSGVTVTDCGELFPASQIARKLDRIS